MAMPSGWGVYTTQKVCIWQGGLWRMMVTERKLGEMKFQLGQAGQLGACNNWPNSHIS
jgi:hypothetical protein